MLPEINDMRICVVGGGGFIGSHIVEHLVDHTNSRVIAVDKYDDKLSTIDRRSFDFHRLDIRSELGELDQLVGACDVVVDVAAYANPSIYVTAPLEVFDLNFTQNIKIAELCIKHRKRLIQYSSAEVYGKADGGRLYSEDTTDLVLGPVHKHRWIYAAAKGLLERVLHAHGLNGDLEYTIIRPFNFLGSRIDYLVAPGTTGGPRVFAHFMSALMSGGPMLLVDGGHVHRAFTHVQDANEAFHILLAKPDQSRNEIYNVGNPTNDITIRELAHLMSEIYGELTGKIAASEIREISGTDFYGEGYEDSSRLPPDIRKLEALGWTPKCDLRSALRDAMAYYLQRGADLPSSMPPDRRTVAS